MERTPFDGCVYHVVSDAGANLAWQAFGRRAFGEADFRGAIADLRATRFRAFHSNLLRLNVTPADVDWYDDFSAVIQNARLSARIARIGLSAGIALDTEQYEHPLFDYSRQRDAGRRSFLDYAAQARRRGQELMRSLEEEHPGLTVMLTFGHSYVAWQMRTYKKPQAEVSYGLLASFVDGLIDGAARAKIVDGYEAAYGFREPASFDRAYQLMRAEAMPIVAEAAAYRRTVRSGFGIWMDFDWRQRGWRVSDFETNYFSPPRLYTVVRKALETSDGYVWVYGETPRWWSPEGGPAMLPAAYDYVLRRAKRDALRATTRLR
jgi:hypothetical protein